MSTDLDKISACYSDVGIEYVIRSNGEYQYLFIGISERAADILWLDDNFETTNLDLLLKRNKFMEFHKGELASY